MASRQRGINGKQLIKNFYCLTLFLCNLQQYVYQELFVKLKKRGKFSFKKIWYTIFHLEFFLYLSAMILNLYSMGNRKKKNTKYCKFYKWFLPLTSSQWQVQISPPQPIPNRTPRPIIEHNRPFITFHYTSPYRPNASGQSFLHFTISKMMTILMVRMMMLMVVRMRMMLMLVVLKIIMVTP